MKRFFSKAMSKFGYTQTDTKSNSFYLGNCNTSIKIKVTKYELKTCEHAFLNSAGDTGQH